jgi:hypothetical protein
MLFRANEGVSRPNGQENDPQFAGVASAALSALGGKDFCVLRILRARRSRCISAVASEGP